MSRNINPGLIIPFMRDTPLFRSAIKSIGNFPGPICAIEHKDIEGTSIENVTVLKNTGKSGADDALRIGINWLNSQGCDTIFYMHSDYICPPDWYEEFLAASEGRDEVGQWNFRHNHYYFKTQIGLNGIQTNELDYETLKKHLLLHATQNHDSKTKDRVFEYSTDFWGSYRTGRTSPICSFCIKDALKVLENAPQNTFALFDVQLSLYLTRNTRWKLFINTEHPGLHISGSGHDGFGADTGTIARQTSALINEDNEIFKKRYGFYPDDYLNFEYRDIFKTYQEELTEAANSNRLTDYNFLLEEIKNAYQGGFKGGN